MDHLNDWTVPTSAMKDMNKNFNMGRLYMLEDIF